MKKRLLIKSMIGVLALFVVSLLNTAKAQSVYVQDASGPNVCDGSAYIYDSTAIASTVVWQYSGAVAQTGSLFIGNLCPGTYVVTYSVSNPAGGTSNVTYTFTITGTSNPCSGFYGIISSTDETATNSCDGTASISLIGGTAPYSYSWSNGSTVGTQNNLCAGNYMVYVADANGCMTADSVYIGTGSIINDSILVINNTPYPGLPVVGTINASIEDCNLNFNAIDSASITNLTYLGSSGTMNAFDSVQVTWSVWDTTGMVIATYNMNYILPNPVQGVYNFSLFVYCTQKSMNYMSLMVTDQYNYTPLAIQENLVFNGKVVNPFTDHLEIELKDNASGNVVLMSAQGQIVQQMKLSNETKISFDTANLATGTYFVQLQLATGVSVLKVVKK